MFNIQIWFTKEQIVGCNVRKKALKWNNCKYLLVFYLFNKCFFYPFRPKLRHVFRNTMSWRNFCGPPMRRWNFFVHSLMPPRKRWKKPRQTSEIGKMNFVRKSLNCVNWQKNEMTSMLAFRNYTKGKGLFEIAIILICVHTCILLLYFVVVLVLYNQCPAWLRGWEKSPGGEDWKSPGAG